MASAYSTPNPKPVSELPAVAAADAEEHPAPGAAIDIALFGGVLLIISLVIVLAIFFLVYWDILVSSVQFPLRPER